LFQKPVPTLRDHPRKAEVCRQDRPPPWLKTGRSAADGLGDAFLGEAVLGRAGELLCSRLGAASALRIALALAHEALERSARKLLGSRLFLAGCRERRAGGVE